MLNDNLIRQSFTTEEEEVKENEEYFPFERSFVNEI